MLQSGKSLPLWSLRTLLDQSEIIPVITAETQPDARAFTASKASSLKSPSPIALHIRNEAAGRMQTHASSSASEAHPQSRCESTLPAERHNRKASESIYRASHRLACQDEPSKGIDECLPRQQARKRSARIPHVRTRTQPPRPRARKKAPARGARTPSSCISIATA